MSPFDIGKLLRGTVKNIKSYINVKLKDQNISEGQFEYFITILNNEGINQNELALLLDVGKTSVTKAMKKLLADDFVKRVIKSDKRNYGLYISDKGKHYSTLFNDISLDIKENMFSNFSDDELKNLIYLLNKMYDNSKKL